MVMKSEKNRENYKKNRGKSKLYADSTIDCLTVDPSEKNRQAV